MNDAPRAPVWENDEIDLRAWVQSLARAWKLIVGITLLALAAAGVYTLLQPPLYEATALVAASVPPDRASLQPQAVAQTVIEIARSDQMVSDLYAMVHSQLRYFPDWRALQGAMEARIGRSPHIVRLMVRAPDAEEAAAVANAWARLLVVRVNDLYLGRNPTPVSALSQGASGQGEPLNPVLLQAQREAAQTDMKGLRAAVYGLEGLERDLQAFRDRVARGDGGTVPLEDQLTTLFLQLRAFGVSVPERIELGSDLIAALTKDRPALLARLDDLSRAVAARKADMEARLGLRQAEVEALDRQMQAAEFRSGVGVFLAVGSGAAAPDRPAYPRPALNLGVGAALGLMAGLAFATAREALRSPVPTALPTPGSEPVAPAGGMVRDKGSAV